jgi:hypothetical protein
VFAKILQMLKNQEYHYGREAQKHEIKMPGTGVFNPRNGIVGVCAKRKDTPPPQGAAWPSPEKPGFRRSAPEMRPN